MLNQYIMSTHVVICNEDGCFQRVTRHGTLIASGAEFTTRMDAEAALTQHNKLSHPEVEK